MRYFKNISNLFFDCRDHFERKKSIISRYVAWIYIYILDNSFFLSSRSNLEIAIAKFHKVEEFAATRICCSRFLGMKIALQTPPQIIPARYWNILKRNKCHLSIDRSSPFGIRWMRGVVTKFWGRGGKKEDIIPENYLRQTLSWRMTGREGERRCWNLECQVLFKRHLYISSFLVSPLSFFFPAFLIFARNDYYRKKNPTFHRASWII